MSGLETRLGRELTVKERKLCEGFRQLNRRVKEAMWRRYKPCPPPVFGGHWLTGLWREVVLNRVKAFFRYVIRARRTFERDMMRLYERNAAIGRGKQGSCGAWRWPAAFRLNAAVDAAIKENADVKIGRQS